MVDIRELGPLRPEEVKELRGRVLQALRQPAGRSNEGVLTLVEEARLLATLKAVVQAKSAAKMSSASEEELRRRRFNDPIRSDPERFDADAECYRTDEDVGSLLSSVRDRVKRAAAEDA